MDLVIGSIDQVTPEWLTSVLVQAGCLQRGEVESFRKGQSPLEGFTSERYHLELLYTESVPKSVPTHLFLKIGRPEFFESGKHEIEFYMSTKVVPGELSLLTCYGASYSPDTKQWHLLLQDLSKTHFTPDFTEFRRDPHALFPLSLSQCGNAIECLAAVHAFWWNDPRLANEMGYRASRVSADPFYRHVEECMAAMFDALGERNGYPEPTTAL